MYGKDTGSLTVYVREGIGGNERVLLKKTGEVGNYWERIDLKIVDAAPFQVIVEATVGAGPFGDMAIDDITFTPDCILDDAATLPTGATDPATTTRPSACGTNFQCKSQTQCVDASKVCDFEYDCDDNSDEEMCGTCDFEKSMCGFYDKSSGRFFWTRAQAPTQNPIGSGPQTDHTYVNDTNTKGYHAITQLTTSSGSFSSRSDLWGPVMGRTSDTCQLTLWAHIRDSDSRISKFLLIYPANLDLICFFFFKLSASQLKHSFFSLISI